MLDSDLKPDAARWYVIQARPRQVARAELNLRNQHFTTYLPRWRVEKLRNGSRVECVEPLFPNYLFISLSRHDENWHKVRSTRGVARLLRFGDDPASVPEAVVAEIRCRAGGNAPQRPVLSAGDRVMIEKGCFHGLEAVFHSFDGAERAVLFLRMLEQQVRATLPLASLRRA
jgi:transcriptional antiterminator RfaH